WTPVFGGAWEKRPSAACPPTPPIGRLAADGKSVQFALPSDLQTSAGVYDLVLMSAPGATDVFQVQLQSPGPESFVPGIPALLATGVVTPRPTAASSATPATRRATMPAGTTASSSEPAAPTPQAAAIIVERASSPTSAGTRLPRPLRHPSLLPATVAGMSLVAVAFALSAVR